MMEKPEVVFDEMRLGDLDQVLEIERLSYPTPWSKRAFQSELTENAYAHYYVARLKPDSSYAKGAPDVYSGGQSSAVRSIVGYIGVWVILDEAHITNVAVHPNFRRMGLGERLMRFAFDKALEFGATRVTLEVRVSNIPAQNLYKKLGFQERGIRKGYYTDTNEDAIIMWKDDLGPQKPMETRVKWMI